MHSRDSLLPGQDLNQVIQCTMDGAIRVPFFWHNVFWHKIDWKCIKAYYFY